MASHREFEQFCKRAEGALRRHGFAMGEHAKHGINAGVSFLRGDTELVLTYDRGGNVAFDVRSRSLDRYLPLFWFMRWFNKLDREAVHADESLDPREPERQLEFLNANIDAVVAMVQPTRWQHTQGAFDAWFASSDPERFGSAR